MIERLSLVKLVDDLTAALVQVDRSGVAHKLYRPGIGPFGEADGVRAALAMMKQAHDGLYASSQTKRTPDLLIPGDWCVELKVIRPFGDNDCLAEHWSQNVLHPYPGNTSSLGDCLKLLELTGPERKGIIVYGFEHSPAKVPLDPCIDGFEILAGNLLGITLGPRVERRANDLIHPVHQVLRVFGWEVCGRTETGNPVADPAAAA